jgi:hypothetical protein
MAATARLGTQMARGMCLMTATPVELGFSPFTAAAGIHGAGTIAMEGPFHRGYNTPNAASI